MTYDYDRVASFINSFGKDDEGLLGEIYEKAVSEKIPVIRRETREFLKVLITEKKPMQVLEIGTAVGYSSLYMSNYLPEKAHITTIELDKARAEEAKENIKRLEKSDRITVLTGDASEVLKTLKKGFDFIFIDAAKAQYINYYEEVIKIINDGGMILSDNVLQEGEILESHYLVAKRNRTIHDRMREYLYRIKNDDRMETAIIPIGDGVALSCMK